MAGRVVTQAISRWLPTVAARVRVRAGVCVGQSGIEAGFLRVLRFPLYNTITPIQWVPGALYSEMKRLGREADLSPRHLVPSSRKLHLYIHSPILLHGVVLN
jgi:hypothetical protein